MKVTLYMDLPPFAYRNYCYSANNQPTTGPLPDGWKRVAFDVELPLRQFDQALPGVQAFEVPSGE